VESLGIKTEQFASGRPIGPSALPEPDIAALAERFDEPLRGEVAVRPPAIPEPPTLPIAPHVPEPPAEMPLQPPRPRPSAKPSVSRNALVAAVAASTLIPLAVILVQLWPETMPADAVSIAPPAKAPGAAETVYAKDVARLKPESEFKALEKEKTALSGAVDVTGSLSSDAAGWSIEPNVASALPFLAPAANPAPEEPDAAAAPSPTVTETADEDEKPYVDVGAPPTPSPTAEAGAPVRTVKVVTIKAPREQKPHDGAYALGAPADEPAAPAEWMVTKTAVDMHAKAQQSSDTVKVAEGGMKVRVTGRQKNWIQVHDPKSSTTGWIYNRFLKPADGPAQ
jgi:Bacterial SH3 domain